MTTDKKLKTPWDGTAYQKCLFLSVDLKIIAKDNYNENSDSYRKLMQAAEILSSFRDLNLHLLKYVDELNALKMWMQSGARPIEYDDPPKS